MQTFCEEIFPNEVSSQKNISVFNLIESTIEVANDMRYTYIPQMIILFCLLNMHMLIDFTEMWFMLFTEIRIQAVV